MSGSLFVVAPPEAQWSLSLADVETHLRQRFPDVLITHETFVTTGEPYFDFQVRLADGETRDGIYAERGELILNEGYPADWADTISWFLGLLPPGTPVVAMVESNPQPVPLPEGVTTPDAVREFFESLS